MKERVSTQGLFIQYCSCPREFWRLKFKQNKCISVLQRALLSVWAYKNTLTNRRFGNYCEKCGQVEVKPTESPKEPLLQTTQISPLGQRLVDTDFPPFWFKCEAWSHTVWKGSATWCQSCLSSAWLYCGFRVAHIEPPNPPGTFEKPWQKPSAGLGLETPLQYNPAPEAHDPPFFHFTVIQTRRLVALPLLEENLTLTACFGTVWIGQGHITWGLWYSSTGQWAFQDLSFSHVAATV